MKILDSFKSAGFFIAIFLSSTAAAGGSGSSGLSQVKNSTGETPDNAGNGSIQLIVRGDDMGFSSSANQAIIKAFQEGILTDTEVLVPGPWFKDAARLCNENPDLDVGVHLTLTSEWDNYEWGPVSGTAGVMDEDGYFADTNSNFSQMQVPEADAETELRAQIELALKYIPQISHLSVHMGAPTSTAVLSRIIAHLSEDYNLPLDASGMNGWQGMWGTAPEEKENQLAVFLNSLRPGRYGYVCHLALLNDESLSIIGTGDDPDERMAVHRQAETDALISSRIRQIIADRGIQLIGYRDTFGPSGTENTDGGIRPEKFILLQNFPNPFNGTTSFLIRMPEAGNVALKIFDAAGREEAVPFDGFCLEGNHQVNWRTENAASGIYFCRLYSGHDFVCRKIILQK